MVDNESIEVSDPTGRTDADWAEINKLRRAFEKGGQAGVSKAMDKLAKDPVRYVTVMGAFFPDMAREAVKDSVAEAGMTEEDVRELIRRLESPARDQ